MARTSPKALVALAITARRTLETLIAHGIKVKQEVLEALAAVERYGRGDKITKAERVKSWKKVEKLGERAWTSDADRAYSWAVGHGAAVVCRMAATGEDYDKLVHDHLTYGLSSIEYPNCVEAIETWYREGLASAAEVPNDQVPAKRIDRKRAAAEAAVLARIARKLGTSGALIAKVNARHAAKYAGDRGKLTALLKRRNYPVHRSVLEFDAAFGGLAIPDPNETDEYWFDNRAYTVVGAYACLTLGRANPDEGGSGLIPVAYTPNDGIMYLDKRGKALFQDSIEDTKATAFAPSGTAAVARLLRWTVENTR